MSEHLVASQVARHRVPVKTIAVGCLLLGGVLGFGAGVLAVKEGRSFVVGSRPHPAKVRRARGACS